MAHILAALSVVSPLNLIRTNLLVDSINASAQFEPRQEFQT
jgi:hypothetical protein